jgi:hypothetical protein
MDADDAPRGDLPLRRGSRCPGIVGGVTVAGDPDDNACSPRALA